MGVAFDRRYELTLSKPIGSEFFGFLPNATVIRGLEIKFKVERSLEPTPNFATIEIYNLNEESRAALQKKPLHVRLDVGYKTDNSLVRLIEGDLVYGTTRRSPPDVVTTLTIGDGERAFVDARVSASFSAGTNLKGAIGVVAESMGLRMPKNANDASELLKQFSNGITLHGRSSTVLDGLIKGSGFSWSMQDGQLQMLRDIDARPGQVELISARTGMVDSPEITAPTQPGKPVVLKFKRRLCPQIVPGHRVKMESAEINGLFRITKITHTGDFRDNDWYSECEANPV